MLSAFALFALAGTLVSAESNVWSVSLHEDAACKDAAISGYSGFDNAVGAFFQGCHIIKAPAEAKALWFKDSETAHHVLTVHADESCGEFRPEGMSCPAMSFLSPMLIKMFRPRSSP